MTAPGMLRRIMRSRATFFILGVLTLLAVLNIDRLLGLDDLEPGELVILSGLDATVDAQHQGDGQRQKLLDEWNRRHPGNRARFQLTSGKADDQHSAMVADAQDKSSTVDIYNLDVIWIAEFASAGYLRELHSVDTDGFLEAPLKAGNYREIQYALPFNTDVGLLYYRTDILKNPNEFPAQLPPGHEQVDTIMKRDTNLKAAYATQLDVYEGLTVNALEAIWAGKDEVVGENGRVAPDLAQEPAGLKRLADAFNGNNPGSILLESRESDEEEARLAFSSGEVALMRNWPVAYHRLIEDAAQRPGDFDIRNKFDVRPLPQGGVLGGQSLAISQRTTRPNAAQALIEFLTSEASQIQLYRDGGLAPTRNAAYDDTSARATRSPQFTDTLRTALQHARQRPVTTHYPVFTRVFQELVNRAIDDHGKLPEGASRQIANALAGKLE